MLPDSPTCWSIHPLGAAKRRETSSTFARNPGLEARPHDGRFLANAAQFSSFVRQRIIDDQGGSHV